jgi:hypothetical protein
LGDIAMARKTHIVVHNPDGGWDVRKGGGQRTIKTQSLLSKRRTGHSKMLIAMEMIHVRRRTKSRLVQHCFTLLPIENTPQGYLRNIPNPSTGTTQLKIIGDELTAISYKLCN